MKIRKLKFDLGTPDITEWIEGNAFKTQLFNAISMSFPFGENYFIKSFKQIQSAGLIRNPQLNEKIRLFISQEAHHSSIHLHFNRYLESRGLPFSLLGWFECRRRFCDAIYDIKTQLAVTMAYEHLTTALSYANLKYAWVADVKDRNIRNMWNWHCAEEIEHSDVAYELYQHVCGGYVRRIYGMLFTVVCFMFDYSMQTFINLWRTNNLFQLKTWVGASSFLFGRQGMAWIMGRAVGQYFHPKWRPVEDYQRYSKQWLNDHANAFLVIK